MSQSAAGSKLRGVTVSAALVMRVGRKGCVQGGRRRRRYRRLDVQHYDSIPSCCSHSMEQ